MNAPKISLEKSGDKVSLAKPSSASGHGRIVCNLNWNAGEKRAKGFFGSFLGKSKPIDLDLGCLYELSDGSKGVVQALGDLFGAFDFEPYINLAGDDRSGTSADGEFMYINGDNLSKIRRICVFAYIYEGVANWAEIDGVVTVTIPGQPMIEVRLDASENNLNMCAIAMIENDNGKLKITKLGKYYSGHRELDKKHKWGMKWVTGSK